MLLKFDRYICGALYGKNIADGLYLLSYRAEELETALMEMVKQDNRRQLSARVCRKLDVLSCLIFITSEGCMLSEITQC